MDRERDAHMRDGEVFTSLSVPLEKAIVLRVDGRGFSKLTEKNFVKPFDSKFARAMEDVAAELAQEFKGVVTYVQSDEVSVLLPSAYNGFGRRVEKLVSTASSIASAHFTLATSAPATFDGRLWVGEAEQVGEYFAWRRRDAFRNSLNSYLYWNLRNGGAGARGADAYLRNMAPDERALQSKLFAEQVSEDVRGGIYLTWNTYNHEGFNPITQEKVAVERRMLDAGASWAEVQELLRG